MAHGVVSDGGFLVAGDFGEVDAGLVLHVLQHLGAVLGFADGTGGKGQQVFCPVFNGIEHRGLYEGGEAVPPLVGDVAVRIDVADQL